MTPACFYAMAPKETLRACPLCDDDEPKLNGRWDRYGLGAQSMRCSCGLVFLSPRMTAEAYRRFYVTGVYRDLLSEFYGKPIDIEAIEKSQRPYSERLSRWLAPHIEPYGSGLLLDLGGSTGVVSERLSYDFNLDATVVEPSAMEAQRARNRGMTVSEVPLEEFDSQGLRYDVVTLCQTVDHLLQPMEALNRIRGWMRRGGLFFLDFVENAPIKIDHPFAWSRETIRQLVTKTGFTVKELAPAGDGLHVNVLAVTP